MAANEPTPSSPHAAITEPLITENSFPAPTAVSAADPNLKSQFENQKSPYSTQNSGIDSTCALPGGANVPVSPDPSSAPSAVDPSLTPFPSVENSALPAPTASSHSPAQTPTEESKMEAPTASSLQSAICDLKSKVDSYTV